MFNVILVDNERLALEELGYFLKKSGEINIVGMYTKPTEAVEEIIKKKPDAVFMDIEMPGMDGITAAEEILKRNEDIEIIFVTAYNEYAVKAFELNAADYVLKPFSEERLKTVVFRILKRNGKATKGNADTINKLVHNWFRQPGREIEKVPCWKDGKLLAVSIENILYFSAVNKEVQVATDSGEIYKNRHTLNYWEEKLAENRFFRCHRSFLVNIRKISEIVPWFNNTFMLKLEDAKSEVPVSRGYIKEFKGIMHM